MPHVIIALLTTFGVICPFTSASPPPKPCSLSSEAEPMVICEDQQQQQEEEEWSDGMLSEIGSLSVDLESIVFDRAKIIMTQQFFLKHTTELRRPRNCSESVPPALRAVIDAARDDSSPLSPDFKQVTEILGDRRSIAVLSVTLLCFFW